MTTIHKIYVAPRVEQNTHTIFVFDSVFIFLLYITEKRRQYFVLLKYAQRKQQIIMLRITNTH